MARRRVRWKTHQGKLDPTRLVFIDETWAKTNMTRSHGRCARGQRLVAKVPHGRWRTLIFLAALRHDRIDAPCVLDGPINGTSFRVYVEQFLVPTLAPGDIVIMDNLGSHKGQLVRRASRAAGARLFFLPPYSPDLTRSSRSSRNSKRCCAKPPSALSPTHGNASANSSTHSRRRSAPTTSKLRLRFRMKQSCSSLPNPSAGLPRRQPSSPCIAAFISSPHETSAKKAAPTETRRIPRILCQAG